MIFEYKGLVVFQNLFIMNWLTVLLNLISPTYQSITNTAKVFQ